MQTSYQPSQIAVASQGVYQLTYQLMDGDQAITQDFRTICVVSKSVNEAIARLEKEVNGKTFKVSREGHSTSITRYEDEELSTGQQVLKVDNVHIREAKYCVDVDLI